MDDRIEVVEIEPKYKKKLQFNKKHSDPSNLWENSSKPYIMLG